MANGKKSGHAVSTRLRPITRNAYLTGTLFQSATISTNIAVAVSAAAIFTAPRSEIVRLAHSYGVRLANHSDKPDRNVERPAD